ncbi:MAG TPA: hypothetical protein VLC29_06325 [Rhizomicrobium sp.]|nr:hypothetical protein [Rhizomicrobium sp.]
MRYVLENIEAGNVSREIERKGISARQRVRVTLDTLEDDLPLAQMAEAGRAFDFLRDEPELYSEADIKQKNV